MGYCTHLGHMLLFLSQMFPAIHLGTPSVMPHGTRLKGLQLPKHLVTSLFYGGGSFISRDNVLVRHGSAADHTDHSLQAHAGPTDLDVAMFHRDAGGVGALGQGGGRQRVSPLSPFFCHKLGVVAGRIGTSFPQVSALGGTYPTSPCSPYLLLTHPTPNKSQPCCS